MSGQGTQSKIGKLHQPAEFAMGLSLIVFCVIGLIWLVPNNVNTGAADFDVGPAFFPKLALWIVLALSVIMTIFAAIGRQAAPVEGGVVIRGVIEATIWVAVALALVFLIPRIGFIPVSIALLIGAFLVARDPKWWRIAVISVAVPVVTSFGAQAVFQVSMP